VTSAAITVACETLDGSNPEAVIKRASLGSAVANSLRQGVPVSIRWGALSMS
jgi:hypothetical protein